LSKLGVTKIFLTQSLRFHEKFEATANAGASAIGAVPSAVLSTAARRSGGRRSRPFVLGRGAVALAAADGLEAAQQPGLGDAADAARESAGGRTARRRCRRGHHAAAS
jgi:hypothetical protein